MIRVSHWIPYYIREGWIDAVIHKPGDLHKKCLMSAVNRLNDDMHSSEYGLWVTAVLFVTDSTIETLGCEPQLLFILFRIEAGFVTPPRK